VRSNVLREGGKEKGVKNKKEKRWSKKGSMKTDWRRLRSGKRRATDEKKGEGGST